MKLVEIASRVRAHGIRSPDFCLLMSRAALHQDEPYCQHQQFVVGEIKLKLRAKEETVEDPASARTSHSGSLAHENGLFHTQQRPVSATREFPLYSDSTFVPEVRAWGPYCILPVNTASERDATDPVAFLRVALHDGDDDFDPATATAERYHGGRIQEEIAALISLELGIRLKAGPATREFNPGGDPLGRPVNYEALGQWQPLLRTKPSESMLPHRLTMVTAADLPLTVHFAQVPAQASIAVAKAARLYQDAVWVADVEPEFAWLLLVSAVETAAHHWYFKKIRVTADELRYLHPNLHQALTKAHAAALPIVAKHLSGIIGSFRKFQAFLEHFFPTPPPVRPAPHLQVLWTAAGLSPGLKTVYEHRSAALHAGTPFPEILCVRPMKAGTGIYEVPPVRVARTVKSGWQHADLPFYLHVFEYLVRASLLQWWGSLVSHDVD